MFTFIKNAGIVVVVALQIVVACNNPSSISQKQEVVKADTVADKLFFPVTDFIGGEIHIVDSLKPPITKTITINKKSSLSSVTDEEFHLLAKVFLESNISDPAVKEFYKETNVADQSTESVNLVYNTNNPTIPIRRVDINIKPDPVLSDKVSSVYIEKQLKAGDTAISQRLIWKAGKNFQIVTEKSLADKNFPRETIKVVWDPTE